MCSGASSRGSLLWYRWTSEKWHASMFRKPDMTAGYLVSLLHRCTIALGKKRHQSSTPARRQRRIISGKVFTASLRKKWKPCQEKMYSGKSPEEPFLQRKFSAGVCCCAGSQGHPGQSAEWARSSPAPFSNQRGSVISSSFLSPPLKQTLQSAARTVWQQQQPGGWGVCRAHWGSQSALTHITCIIPITHITRITPITYITCSRSLASLHPKPSLLPGLCCSLLKPWKQGVMVSGTEPLKNTFDLRS